MTCCTLLVAFTLSMGYGDTLPGHGGSFATPMFLRGQPVWVTPVSRRRIRRHAPKHADPETEVAVVLA